jgi:hypothetical protein
MAHAPGTRRRLVLACLLAGGHALAANAACMRRPDPAGGPGAGDAEPIATKPDGARPEHATAGPSASAGAADASAASPTPGGEGQHDSWDAADDGPYLSGRTWISCYDGFRAASTPARDVQRLALLCGPYHGMRALGPIATGHLPEGGAARAHPFETKPKQCFRAFAAGDGAVAGLDMRLTDPGGVPIAQVSVSGRWAALAPDGVVCPREAGRHMLEVRATAGAGAYAVQVWLLP